MFQALPQTYVHTQTPIDSWFGGLPCDAISVVKGPKGGGKTLLLSEIANNLSHASTKVVFLSSHTPWLCTLNQHPSLDYIEVESFDDVYSLAGTIDPENVLIIDGAYNLERRGRITGALWADLVQELSKRRTTTLLSQRSDKVTPLCNALSYASSMTLDVSTLATTTDGRGLVLEVAAVKCRQAPISPTHRSMWISLKRNS